MVPSLSHNLRVARTTPTIRITRTRRDMLLFEMDPVMDPDMALHIAIIVLMVEYTGVGLDA